MATLSRVAPKHFPRLEKLQTPKSKAAPSWETELAAWQTYTTWITAPS